VPVSNRVSHRIPSAGWPDHPELSKRGDARVPKRRANDLGTDAARVAQSDGEPWMGVGRSTHRGTPTPRDSRAGNFLRGFLKHDGYESLPAH
jgi:hypothetical protein